MEDKLIIGGHEFNSRFILGSGKFSLELVNAVIKHGGAEIVTLALRRANKGGEEKMRLDKFLKVSRLIKRRTVANEACDAGRVLVNGNVAKASVKVKPGDVIEIQFGTKNVKVEVLDIQDTTKKEEAKDLFKYL